MQPEVKDAACLCFFFGGGWSGLLLKMALLSENSWAGSFPIGRRLIHFFRKFVSHHFRGSVFLVVFLLVKMRVTYSNDKDIKGKILLSRYYTRVK